MLRKPSILLLLSLFFAPTLFGLVNVFTISPTSGPSSGGTAVTIKGDFSGGPYTVVFGSIPAISVVKVDAQTLTAISPAHLPGVSTVVVSDGGPFSFGSLIDFTYEGDVPAAFERILVPLFTSAVRGAFGSEFHTSLAAWNADPTSFASVFGLERACIVCLIQPIPPEKLIDLPLTIPPESTLDSLFGPVIASGTPGRFIFVPAEDAKNLTTNLRVHDVTRAALNLGTEIPVVRSREFVTSETLALTAVPIDSKFRNTLRIYAAAETDVVVTFLSNSVVGTSQRIVRQVHLAPGRHLFEPAYAAISDFPTFLTNASPITVTIAQAPRVEGAPPLPPMWAFISITNNETQMITTITPQR